MRPFFYISLVNQKEDFKMKKIFAMFAAFACAAVLSACNDQKAESKAQADESLNKVKAAGEFVLGLDDSFPPMGFRDKDNNIVGFDIDLATEVCARLGVKLKTQPISWDAKEQELNTGKIDCIWNGMSVDSARAKAMNLSDPYLKNRMIFTVKDKALASLAYVPSHSDGRHQPGAFSGRNQAVCGNQSHRFLRRQNRRGNGSPDSSFHRSPDGLRYVQGCPEGYGHHRHPPAEQNRRCSRRL